METQQKTQAKSLYFISDLSQQQIADVVGINRKTLYTWITQGKWTRTRNTDNLTPMRLIHQYYTQLENLNIRMMNYDCPPLEFCKVMTKIAGVIKVITPKQSKNQYSSVMHEFITQFAKQDPALANQIKPISSISSPPKTKTSLTAIASATATPSKTTTPPHMAKTTLKLNLNQRNWLKRPL